MQNLTEFGQNAINLIVRPLTLLSLSTEQDLESGRWPSHQWLLPSQDGRHSGRAGGGARHCPGFPLPVTVTPRCPEFSSPKGALLSALRFHHNKPSKLAPACHLCVYVFMRVSECVSLGHFRFSENLFNEHSLASYICKTLKNVCGGR